MKKNKSPEILLRTIRRLVAEYGQNKVQSALDLCELTAPPKGKRPGHPKEFDIPQLFAVWLYVEEGAKRSQRSTSAFCAMKGSAFQWISIGKKGFRLEKTIKGKTLQRRYQEAMALLLKEAEPYRKLANGSLGFKMSAIPNDGLSPNQRYLKQQLKNNLLHKVVR